MKGSFRGASKASRVPVHLSLGHYHTLGHSDAHWFGLTSPHRRENNGIAGSQTYQGRERRDALDPIRCRSVPGCATRFPASPECQKDAERYRLLSGFSVLKW